MLSLSLLPGPVAISRARGTRWYERPDQVLLASSLFFGFILVFLTPPMQAPDEPNHLYRIWQISQGQLVSRNYEAQVPRDVDRLGTAYKKKHLREPLIVSWRKLQEQFPAPPSVQSVVTEKISNTAVYSPVAYAPQVTGFLIGRAMGFSALSLMYVGRSASVLAYAGLGFCTVRTLPVFKWAACITLASPMAVFEAATLSADGMTIATTFLATALVVRCCVTDHPLSFGQAATLVAIMMAVTLCKSAYFPEVLLLLCIRAKRWPAPAPLWPMAGILLCTVVFVGWSALTHPLGTHMNAGVSPPVQVHFLEEHVLLFPGIFLRTLFSHRWILLESFVGDFGWLDVALPTFSVFLFLGFLAMVAIGSGDKFLLARRVRLLMFAAGICSAVLIGVADYVLFTRPGAREIEGLQGRYFLPLSVLVFAAVQNRADFKVRPAIVCVFVNGYLLATLWTVFIFFYRF